MIITFFSHGQEIISERSSCIYGKVSVWENALKHCESLCYIVYLNPFQIISVKLTKRIIVICTLSRYFF